MNHDNEFDDPAASNDDVDRVVARGPHGAVAVTGVATAIVTALWFAFYFGVFLPRGAVQ